MDRDGKGRVIVDDLVTPSTPEQIERLHRWFDRVTGINVIMLPYHEHNPQLELWPDWYGFF